MPRDRSEFDDLAPLIKLIRAHPPFDREQELVVTRKARKGNRRAQEQLVVHNLSLVISVARKFMGRGVRLEDLVQEGNYGLLKAIEHFDPEKGNRFSTYAVWWIRAYITRSLKDGPSAVRRTMPHGGLPPRDISLEESIDPEGESTHLDRLKDEGPTPDEQVIRAERQKDVRSALGRVRKRMGELAWDILNDRLTQEDPRTLEDLGKQWGLSRERVNRLLFGAAESILQLAEVDLVRFEAGSSAGSHTLALWEELAPVMSETVESVNRLVAVAEEVFPPRAEGDLDAGLDAAFGSASSDSVAERPPSKEEEIAGMVSADSMGLRRDVTSLRSEERRVGEAGNARRWPRPRW